MAKTNKEAEITDLEVQAEKAEHEVKDLAPQQQTNFPVQMPTGDVTPNMLLQMAVQGNADIDKLEKLMALQERHEANEAKKAYVRAMTQFRSKCPTIIKDQSVSFETSKGKTEYKHAGLSGTIEQIKAIMTECGLSHSWRTEQVEDKVKITCIVSHELGHSEQTSLVCAPDISGGKNPIQSLGSTQSYLERYTLSAILGLASAEDDDGMGGPASPGCSFEECEEIGHELIQIGALSEDEDFDVDKEEERLLKKIGANSISEMTHAQYEKAMKLIKAKKDYIAKTREKK